MKTEHGFTLMEMMIVVVLVGILAAFAIPNYDKAVKKAYERSAITQLTTIHAANEIYRAQNGTYWPSSLADADEINTALDINIIPENVNYSYGLQATIPFAIGSYDNDSVQVLITQTPISRTSVPPNPCCRTNNCLIAPDC